MNRPLAALVPVIVASGLAASCGASDGPAGGAPGVDASTEDRAASCGSAGESCCNGAACDNGLLCTRGTCAGTGAGEADVAPDLDGEMDVAADSPDARGDASFDGATDGPFDGSTGACAAGEYRGPFGGLYTSGLLVLGVGIPVAGQIDITLDPAGRVQGGTVAGLDDAIPSGDASVGGFPFFCTVTGALDCAGGKLDGWMQCAYCVGPLADGGSGCSVVGGRYAGPLTAGYDAVTSSFVMGTWNGAEALAGNDGGSPGPDGGPIGNYLSDAGIYTGSGNFGGSGTWRATHLVTP